MIISGDRVESDALPNLPQVLASVTRVKQAIEGLESLPPNFAQECEVSTVARLRRRLKALSTLPHGMAINCVSCLLFPVPLIRMGGHQH